ncbi:MAG TPA: histidine kinase dimerization/phospho-acceptor domain-containing protein [Marmoricola sp.]|jgi:signal transduction histidine kinase|nr:histidine kinase dimerization/phospho-acceptor domain-containing protein [Marmoricola sp.]
MSILVEHVRERPTMGARRRAGLAAAPSFGALSTGGTPQHVPEIESALFAALLNQQHLGVGVCSPDGVLMMANAAFDEMFGDDRLPVVQPAWPHRPHLHDEQGQPLDHGQDPLARALRGEVVTAQVVTVQRPDRPVRFLRCSAFQLRGSRARMLAAVIFAVDITDWMTEQHRLEELRDQLVTAVNHEVRTPLAVILGHMELINEQDTPLPESVTWSLEAIDRAAGHLEEVVGVISEIADESLAMGPR